MTATVQPETRAARAAALVAEHDHASALFTRLSADLMTAKGNAVDETFKPGATTSSINAAWLGVVGIEHALSEVGARLVVLGGEIRNLTEA